MRTRRRVSLRSYWPGVTVTTAALHYPGYGNGGSVKQRSAGRQGEGSGGNALGRGMPETPCVCPSVSLSCSLGSLTYQSNMWGLTVRENQSCCLCAELQRAHFMCKKRAHTEEGRDLLHAINERAKSVASLPAPPCPEERARVVSHDVSSIDGWNPGGETRSFVVGTQRQPS